MKKTGQARYKNINQVRKGNKLDGSDCVAIIQSTKTPATSRSTLFWLLFKRNMKEKSVD